MELLEIMQGLKKRIDVSQDGSKTKERAEQLWKSLNNKGKREILELADVSSATAHKVYQQGSLTAGLAIAFAKVCGVSPSYVTAHSDARGKFTKQSLNSFLEACGYAYLTAKAAPAPVEEAEPEVVEQVISEACCSDEAHEGCDCPFCGEEDDFDFGEDELIVLLRALNIRARWNDDARETLGKVVELLL